MAPVAMRAVKPAVIKSFFMFPPKSRARLAQIVCRDVLHQFLGVQLCGGNLGWFASSAETTGVSQTLLVAATLYRP